MLTRQKEISDLISCSYQNWYEDFRKNSIKSFVLPIPTEVLNYLKQDLFILPKECTPVGGSSACASYVGEESNFDDEDTEGTDIPEFPSFSKEIIETLNKLGELEHFQIRYIFSSFNLLFQVGLLLLRQIGTVRGILSG